MRGGGDLPSASPPHEPLYFSLPKRLMYRESERKGIEEDISGCDSEGW